MLSTATIPRHRSAAILYVVGSTMIQSAFLAIAGLVYHCTNSIWSLAFSIIYHCTFCVKLRVQTCPEMWTESVRSFGQIYGT